MTANCENKCIVNADRNYSSNWAAKCEADHEQRTEMGIKLEGDRQACLNPDNISCEITGRLPSNGTQHLNQARMNIQDASLQEMFVGNTAKVSEKAKEEPCLTGLPGSSQPLCEQDQYSQFYFESDHLALKDNKHYHLLLQALLVLEAQRSQAVKDLDILCEQQAKALQDPIGFVEKLQENEPLGLPSRQRVVKLPSVPWEEYSSCIALSPLEQQKWSNPHHTRAAAQNLGKVQTTQQSLESCSSAPASSESNIYSVFGGEFVASKHGKTLDRDSLTSVLGLRGELANAKLAKGRLYDESKSMTFNQPWTTEEQAKLENLLQVYPQEEVESKRWEKIAAALGNRTLKQVASRVQKYFIKLAKAGLPVPGRMPNIPRPGIRSKRSHHHYQTLGFRNSTFFPSYQPRVFMDDEDDVSSVATDDTSGCLSDEESIPADLRDTEQYRELMDLKRIKRQKIIENQQRNEEPAHHNGFMCDGCGIKPIHGTRWHCQDCPQDSSADFCSECVQRGNVNSGKHCAEHTLDPITRSASFFVDGDYLGLSEGSTSAGYNYLDPNFLPAAS